MDTPISTARELPRPSPAAARSGLLSGVVLTSNTTGGTVGANGRANRWMSHGCRRWISAASTGVSELSRDMKTDAN